MPRYWQGPIGELFRFDGADRAGTGFACSMAI
jgi:hypothetical protein